MVMSLHILFTIAYFLLDISLGQYINVAVGKPAYQPSTLQYEGYYWTADKAVDGRIDQKNPENSTSCSGSDNESNNYWMVNLTRQYQVVKILIYPRTDQKNDQVNGSDLYITEEAKGNLTRIRDQPLFENDTYIYQLSPPRTVFEVVLKRQPILVICEAEVFAVCDDGFFGQNCSGACGRCLNNTACNKTTGVCPRGCDRGAYGKFCRRCGNCSNSQPCDTTSGYCEHGCEPGWKGNLCKTPCDHSEWGANCRNNCSNCINETVCSGIDGSCPSGCENGWTGTRCDTECNESWGYNCANPCGNCYNGESCNRFNGSCVNGCGIGWQGFYCNEATPSENGKGKAAIIGGCIGGVLCISIVVFAIIVWRKRIGGVPWVGCVLGLWHFRDRRNKDKERENLDGSTDPVMISHPDRLLSVTSTSPGQHKSIEPVCTHQQSNMLTDIPVSNIREFCRVNCVKPSPLLDEFATLPCGLQYDTKEAVCEGNKIKNRYRFIYPYDKNRVKLPKNGGTLNSDYINASFIEGYSNECAYIASQGVMENTVNDYWWMIWSQDIYNIVMLTECYEAGKSKCFKYWPESGGTECYENLSVSVTKEEKYFAFIVRTLLCKYAVDQTQRIITQFHYIDWPDKDVPDYSLSLVQFWRKVKFSSGSDKRPWLVHCSAGVGRTGTFIALDILYDQAKADEKVDIYSCVKRLRQQRVTMVQTANQYLFLHEGLAEAVQPIGHTYKVANGPEFLAELKQVAPDYTSTQLEREFEQLQRETEDNMANKQVLPVEENVYQNIGMGGFADSKLPENVNKTRDQTVMPYDQFRPRLITQLDGRNDYINAVELQTYLKPRGLIITQTPLSNTVDDFLRLVWDYDVTTIVMMDGDQTDENTGRYWPSGKKNHMTDLFNMTVLSDSTEKAYIKREMQLLLKEKTRRITQLHYTNWLEGSSIPQTKSSFLQFLDVVNLCHSSASDTPLIVHCLNGADRSGLFCVIWAIMERIKEESEVAVAETVRTMKFRRPQIIPNKDQYEFCYDLAQEHLKSVELYANLM